METIPSNANNLCVERKLACDHRFDDLREIMSFRFESQKEALGVAREEMNRRLEGMNEFRDQLTRQASTFLEIKTYDAEHKLLTKEVDTIREWKAKGEGERSKTVVISWIALIISIATSVLHIIQEFAR